MKGKGREKRKVNRENKEGNRCWKKENERRKRRERGKVLESGKKRN